MYRKDELTDNINSTIGHSITVDSVIPQPQPQNLNYLDSDDSLNSTLLGLNNTSTADDTDTDSDSELTHNDTVIQITDQDVIPHNQNHIHIQVHPHVVVNPEEDSAEDFVSVGSDFEKLTEEIDKTFHPESFEDNNDNEESVLYRV